MELETTLVLLKPDAVERGLMGTIISRFEQAGLKIVGMKLVQVDEEFAGKHYTEDIAIRRGEHVRKYMTDFLSSGPVLAMAISGVESIALVRKMVGATEPKSALPGTIRGDFAHVSYGWFDSKKQRVKNIIHASADENDAKNELALWFSESELCNYQSVHEKHVH